MKKIIIIFCLLAACRTETKQNFEPLTQEQRELIKVIDSYSLEHISSKAAQRKSSKNKKVIDLKKDIKRQNQKVKPFLK